MSRRLPVVGGAASVALGAHPADEPQSREAIRAAIAGNSLGSVDVLWGEVALAAALSFGAAVGLRELFERRALSTGSIVRY